MSSLFTVPELAIGVGLSEAASAAFEPKVEVPKQQAWLNNPQRIPDVGLIAALVAGGKVTQTDGRNMAARLGFDQGPFDSLTWLAQNRLDFPLMLRLWRLFPNYASPSGKSIDQLVDETLAHEQLDWDYHKLLTQLKTAERPGIGDLASSVVRGYLPTNIQLPVAPPATNDYVPRFPQSDTLAEDLAAQIGYDPAMLELMIARSGLSMAPVMAANALFRSDAAVTIKNLPDVPGVAPFTVKPYVGPNDYKLAISEGDLRTEWADAVRETSRQILTNGQYAESQLRGFLTKEQRRALTAQHGTSEFDSDLLYDVLGRGLNYHQVVMAEARGGVYNGPTDMIPEPILAAMRRSNLRPEFYNLAWALRYTYSVPFWWRAITTAGAITATEAEDLLLRLGNPPTFAATITSHFAGSTTAAADKDVTSAQTKLKTRTHSSYIAEEIDDPTATTSLTTAGVAASAIPLVLAQWGAERALIRKQLSPTQIRKALNLGLVNPATGQPYTNADAIALMLARGYDQGNAEVFLQE